MKKDDSFKLGSIAEDLFIDIFGETLQHKCFVSGKLKHDIS